MMSEIGLGIKISWHAFVVGEFATTVTSDGIDSSLVSNEHFGDACRTR